MQLLVAAVGQRMPPWVNEAWHDYRRRMPPGIALALREVPLGKRTKNADIPRLVAEESRALAAAMPERARRVVLDIRGRPWTTRELSRRLEFWMADGRDVGFMIGGPDGVDSAIVAESDERWSLGPLTLPHPLVRVVVAEQLYRAWTITQHHPYHRA
jgi:23S rRNA (pseudouridine1915-N3)-methyltransferase